MSDGWAGDEMREQAGCLADENTKLKQAIKDGWVSLVTQLANTIHQEAVAHGFYPNGIRNEAECIALMHSELSEALEGLRHGNGTGEHIPEFSQVEEELADCLIRIFDYAGWKRLRLAEAMLAKMAFNKTRPLKHGKNF